MLIKVWRFQIGSLFEWRPEFHKFFSKEFDHTIVTLLVERKRKGSLLNRLPKPVLLMIVQEASRLYSLL